MKSTVLTFENISRDNFGYVSFSPLPRITVLKPPLQPTIIEIKELLVLSKFHVGIRSALK